MTTTDNDTLRRLAEAATPGPWPCMADTLEIYRFHDDTGLDKEPHSTPIAQGEYDRARSEEQAIANAAYIVAACNAVPALLDANARQAAEIAALREALDELLRTTWFDGPGAGKILNMDAVARARTALASRVIPLEKAPTPEAQQ